MDADTGRRRVRLSRDLAVFSPRPASQCWRPLRAADQPVVAALLYDAYLVSPTVSSVKNSTPGTGLPALSSVNDVTASPPSSALAARPQTPPSYSPNLWWGTLATDPAWRSQGWATRLIEQAASALAEQGERRMNLVVTVGNPAQQLYERLGFHGWDQRPPTAWQLWDDHG